MAARVFILANPFPYGTTVGVHRTAGLCRHLAARGWDVTVIASRPAAGSPAGEHLPAAIPPELRVLTTAGPDLPRIAAQLFRRHASRPPAAPGDAADPSACPSPSRRSLLRWLVDWSSWWLHVPDGRTGWLAPAVAAGLARARRARPDVIYASGPPWTNHLAAAALSSLLGAAFVADFRDPWFGSAWRRMPYAAHRRVDGLLERIVVRRARAITCAWDGIRRHLARRYPQSAGRMLTVLNGFDPEQIDPVEPARLADDRCVLLHAGTFYGPRSPLPLLEGMAILKSDSPRLAGKLLAALMGWPTYDAVPLADLVARHGADGMVRVLPARSHRGAMAALKGADVALLFGQSDSAALASVPAKAYEFIGAGKPVLAIGAGDEATAILRRGGCRLWCAAGPREVAAALKEIALEYGRGAISAPVDPAARAAFTRQRMAARLERVLRAAAEAPLGRAAGTKLAQAAGCVTPG